MRIDGLSEANNRIEIWGRVGRNKLLIYCYVTVSDERGLIQK